MHEALLQALAMLSSLCGMGWLALAMEEHWRQVRGAGVPPAARLRALAVAACAVSLGLCLAADHPSIAALLWIMSLVTGVLLVAFTLATCPRWLRWLVPSRA